MPAPDRDGYNATMPGTMLPFVYAASGSASAWYTTWSGEGVAQIYADSGGGNLGSMGYINHGLSSTTNILK